MITSDIALECVNCFSLHSPDMYQIYCKNCNNPLIVKYPSFVSEFKWQGIEIPMPISSNKDLLTLGEGNTPIVSLSNTAILMGLNNVKAKLEFMNPTGSFKDRGTALMISVAKEMGIQQIVEDSSGNAGSSVAAYCSKGDIKAHIFVPSSAPQPKLDQISVYGSSTHIIDGSREEVTDAATQFVDDNQMVYGTHKLSPYFLEGTKTFAYELCNDDSYVLPDDLLMPVGNGSLYIGAWLGFQELLSKGMINHIPRMHVIQADSVKPLVDEFMGIGANVNGFGTTVAGGISVADPPRSQQIMKILKETHGQAISVSDSSIIDWQRVLAQKDGIYCEPTSAAAIAGLHELVKLGHINKDNKVLVAITGFGLKDKVYI